MRLSITKPFIALVYIALGAALVLVVWQPVIPSGWLIKGMADGIDPQTLSLEKPAVLRFELSGQGGGDYNILLSKEKVEFTEGSTNRADLIVAMKATDFNQLAFMMAQGKADESAFTKLYISNMLKMAGDMNVLSLLAPAEVANP
ncbi:MAG: SCP2 sterol-binding domain-containing protein [Proteobacteria bacterium]|nr:SCP2 sterol-binding domain-containing protein [Pseudomonadota bacterium]